MLLPFFLWYFVAIFLEILLSTMSCNWCHSYHFAEELEKALPENILQRYEERVQEELLNLANIELVS